VSGNYQRASQRRSAIKLVGDKTATLGLARGRLIIIKAFFVIVFLLVGVRASDLAILQKKDAPSFQAYTVEELVDKNQAQKPRGTIYDRNGVVVATTLKVASVYADPHLISDPTQTAKSLVKIFPDLPYGKTLKNLQSKKRFVWIKRNIMPADQQAILRIGEPGLEFEYEHARFYPQGNLLSHWIGYTNVDAAGISGVEKSFDGLLSSGDNVTLSVDTRLQHVLRREIIKASEKFDAIGGTGVIMDVHSGEVLAGVSWPDFNLNDLNTAKDSEKFSRLTLGTYELGSVFKIFSTAAYLENFKAPMGKKFDTSNPIKRGRFSIRDFHPEKRPLTIPEVFMYSSNIGTAMMGEELGTEKLRDFYKDLGLMDIQDIEVPEKASPQIPSPWRDLNTLTASYGHGIAVTPLHVASAVSTTINGGFTIKPTVIKSEVSTEEQSLKSQKLAVMSSQTSDDMRALLRLVVTEGTGSNAEVKGYRVGGKTGTAEKPSKRGYNRKSLISSFVGAFPMQDPKYVVYIAIDEPKGIKETYGYATGGWVAAPAVSNVIAGMVTLMGLPPHIMDQEKDVSYKLKKYVALKNG